MEILFYYGFTNKLEDVFAIVTKSLLSEKTDLHCIQKCII